MCIRCPRLQKNHKDRVALPSYHLRLATRKPLPEGYPEQLLTLGDHLRKRRLDLGLLQKEVAEQIGANVMTIVNWEKNHTSPALRFVPGIVGFLGYNLNNETPGSLGQRLIAARRRLGLSQKGLASLLEIDPTTLARWERNEGVPSRKLMPRVDAFLTSHTLDR